MAEETSHILGRMTDAEAILQIYKDNNPGKLQSTLTDKAGEIKSELYNGRLYVTSEKAKVIAYTLNKTPYAQKFTHETFCAVTVKEADRENVIRELQSNVDEIFEKKYGLKKITVPKEKKKRAVVKKEQQEIQQSKIKYRFE